MNEIISAYKSLEEVLKEKGFFILFAILSIFFIVSYAILSSWIESYGTSSFTISTFSIFDYTILLSLGLFTALLVLVQIFIFIHNKTPRINAIEKMLVSVTLLLPATLLYICNNCSYIAIKIFGITGGAFISEYKMYFIYSGIALAVVTLYTSILNLQGYCNTCKV